MRRRYARRDRPGCSPLLVLRPLRGPCPASRTGLNVGAYQYTSAMQKRHRGRQAVPLRLRDLTEPTSTDMPRTFGGRLIRIERRTTSRGLRWGVLTFRWVAGHELRCPLFPTLWAATAPPVVGRTYQVTGKVAFRDGAPAIGIVAIGRRSARRSRIRSRVSHGRQLRTRPPRRHPALM